MSAETYTDGRLIIHAHEIAFRVAARHSLRSAYKHRRWLQKMYTDAGITNVGRMWFIDANEWITRARAFAKTCGVQDE